MYNQYPEGKSRRIILGQKIKEARLARGLTQQDLAEEGTVTAPAISQVERGVFLPSHALLRYLAGKLELNSAELSDLRDEAHQEQRQERSVSARWK